jgi:hypothetical protein
MPTIDQRLTMPLPEVDDAMRARAVALPDRRLIHLDPAIAEGEHIDSVHVMGWREFDEAGNVVDEWINEQFMPQPATAGGTVTNVFELALWRLCTGFIDFGRFVDAFAGAEVWVEHDVTNSAGAWHLLHQAGGYLALRTYTSSRLLTDNRWPHWRRVTGAQIITELGQRPNVLVDFNPQVREACGWQLLATDLADLWAQRQEAASTTTRTAPPVRE